MAHQFVRDSDPAVAVRVCRYASPQRFLDRCQAWLLLSEIENSQILATVRLLAEGNHAFEPPYYLATIESATGIVGCAARAPPDHVIHSTLPLEAIPLLAADISTVYDELPGVSGREVEASAFATHWMQSRGECWSVNKRWRWYAVKHVTVPAQWPSGTLRRATLGELDLVRNWAQNFARETGVLTNVVNYYERRVRTGSLYVWDNGGPRSVVAVSGVTPNTVRLSGVYTYPGCRRQGYATAVVAAVSQTMLDAGSQFCLLFEDSARSNGSRLYENIGYDSLFEKVSIRLSA